MKNILIYFSSIIFLCSCSAVFEKPLTDKSIEIYTPADSFKTKKYTQQFYWEKVDGATNYRLQIAQPGFASIQGMLMDSITTSNSISFTLSPGEYEWRLRAQNGGSETAYFTRKLFIVETAFEERPMTVTLPASSKVTYVSDVEFDWIAVTGAEKYMIEIDTFNGNFVNPKVTPIDGSLLTGVASLSIRGKYKWRMYADSAGTKSSYSSIGTIDFKLDTASLSTPENNATGISQNADFVWKAPANQLTSDKYTYQLYLYDSATDTKVSTVTGYTFPLTINKETTQIMGLTKGKTYYWTIQAYDQYNVPSLLTARRKFTVSN